MINIYGINLAVKVITSVAKGGVTNLNEGQILELANNHQRKINEFLRGNEGVLTKISTTPMLTDKTYVITTTITHTIKPNEDSADLPIDPALSE